MSWTTISSDVHEAARDPDIAAVLAKSDAVAQAIVARDGDAFTAGHSSDAVINSPANRIITAAQSHQGFLAGLIDYHSIDRRIDYAARLPEGLIVIMGEETATPRDRAHHAGKTIRRRFTDLWRNEGDEWRIAVRQATVIDVQ